MSLVQTPRCLHGKPWHSHKRYDAITAVMQPGDVTFTGRGSLFLIACKTCNVVLHTATTGPEFYAEEHLRERDVRI